MKGFIVLSRNLQTCTIELDSVSSMEEYFGSDRRIIYCQAISDVHRVAGEIDRLIDEFEESSEKSINEAISDLVISAQWVANEYPLDSFRPVGNDSDAESETNTDT